MLFLNMSLANETHSTISDAYSYPAMDLAWQATDIVRGFAPFVSFAKFRVAYGQVGVRPSAHAF